MRRLLLACLAGLVSSGAWAESPYERVSARVACLVSEFPDGGKSIGSSFYVAPGILATAMHQVRGARRIVAHLPDGAVVEAKPLALEKAGDAALLQVPGAGPGSLALHAGVPVLGEEVFTVGCPLGLSHTLTRGVVSHPDRLIEGRRLIQTDLAINEGNSGGPLANARGEVLGVVHGRLTQSRGINFAVPADVFRALLGRAVPAAAEDPLPRLWREASAAGDDEARAGRYMEILMRAPWAAEAYYNLGLIRLSQGKLDEAREHFLTASLKKTPYPEALNNLGVAQLRQGRYQEARDTLVRAVSATPGFALAYLNLGIAYAQGQGDRESAKRNFRRYLELAPGAAQAAVVRRWLDSELKTP
ncbi:MAG TPA: trypsin-like peptidase domain-containing protein [Thiobacillaceae bacterium]|nr:trypsin-like peptidase domain-containing protein [Thiobacillaceae bacterium]